MSSQNFMAYGDAESVLTGYATRIKQSPTTFIGTMAEWNALSAADKAKYTIVDITDDMETGGGHTIENDSQALTQRDTLKFEGFTTADDSTAEKTVVKNPMFTGTTAQWNALSSTEKAKYKLVSLTDDGESGDVVDALENGNMNPVTSNAVYDATRIVLGTIEIGPLTIAAGQVATFNNTTDVIKGKRFNGIEILNVANFNISVTQAYIDSAGFHGVIKNNGSSEITTGRIIVHYSN